MVESTAFVHWVLAFNLFFFSSAMIREDMNEEIAHL